jgi:hypothetical protein
MDAEGKVLYEGPMGAGTQLGPYRLDPSGIATVDVRKSPDGGNGRVVIRLKPGVVPGTAR